MRAMHHGQYVDIEISWIESVNNPMVFKYYLANWMTFEFGHLSAAFGHQFQLIRGCDKRVNISVRINF